MKYKHYLLSILFLSISVKAQIIDTALPTNLDSLEIFTFYPWSDEYSIDELPQKVIAQDNKLSLFIDYNDIDSLHGLITAYLINKTSKKYFFRMSSIHSVILPEYKIQEDCWQRYIAFNYGWCGTPYVGNDEIDSLKFRKVICSYPIKGEKKLIRYQLYDYPPVISNEGFGYVDSSHLKLPLYDDLAFEFSNLLFLSKIAYGDFPKDMIESEQRSLRFKAIQWMILLFGKDKSNEVLSRMIENQDEFSTYANKLLSKKKN